MVPGEATGAAGPQQKVLAGILRGWGGGAWLLFWLRPDPERRSTLAPVPTNATIRTKQASRNVPRALPYF